MPQPSTSSSSTASVATSARREPQSAAVADASVPTRRQTLLWWGLAIAAIVLGFADLARGGETLAPLLLMLGYCVLVPIAILK